MTDTLAEGLRNLLSNDNGRQEVILSSNLYERISLASDRIEADAARIKTLKKALREMGETLTEIVEALRKDAPGTPLNNHKYDRLGMRATSAISGWRALEGMND
jgi:hypothetical protein